MSKCNSKNVFFISMATSYNHTSSTNTLSGPCKEDAALFSLDKRLSALLAISALLPVNITRAVDHHLGMIQAVHCTNYISRKGHRF